MAINMLPLPPPQVALVTGAAHRVGAEIVRWLHQAGLNIIIHYRSSDCGASALQAELQRQRPDSVALLQGDLLHTDALPQLVQQAYQQWGRLDLLVNNASTFYPTAVGTITEQQWDDLMGSNLKAPLFLSQAAAPYLRVTEGAIVNIVDIHAQRPLSGYPLYSVAKAGLAMLTQALAMELGPEIRVNGVAPGAILWPENDIDSATKTEILARTCLKRQGSPTDIARAVLYLFRDAPYTTGQVLAVDGGRSIKG